MFNTNCQIDNKSNDRPFAGFKTNERIKLTSSMSVSAAIFESSLVS